MGSGHLQLQPDWFEALERSRDFIRDASSSEGQEAVASMKFALLTLTSLAEQAEHSFLVQRAGDVYRDFEADPLATRSDDWSGENYWAHAANAYHLYKVLSTLHPRPDDSKLRQDQVQLEAIIRRSKHFIVDRRVFPWLPCDENDVHDRIEGLVRCVYPDTDRKKAIPQATKNFIPDTSVPSIRTLIEYKYVKNRNEVPTYTDQILADLGGYQGGDPEQILFVIYETSRWTSEDQWQRSIDGAKPASRASVIVIEGEPPQEKDFELKREFMSRNRDGLR